jgi:hypothetical protein
MRTDFCTSPILGRILLDGRSLKCKMMSVKSRRIHSVKYFSKMLITPHYCNFFLAAVVVVVVVLFGLFFAIPTSTINEHLASN